MCGGIPLFTKLTGMLRGILASKELSPNPRKVNRLGLSQQKGSAGIRVLSPGRWRAYCRVGWCYRCRERALPFNPICPASRATQAFFVKHATDVSLDRHGFEENIPPCKTRDAPGDLKRSEMRAQMLPWCYCVASPGSARRLASLTQRCLPLRR